MKTLIVGGGLSGLALAEALEAQGRDYVLVEARERFGGRILTEHLEDGYFDLGPAWFWSGQPRILGLIDRFNLMKFNQYSDGYLTQENEMGQVQRGRGHSTMEGSWRLEGGFGKLTNILANQIPDKRKRLNSVVMKLEKTAQGCIVTLKCGEHIYADQVVLALPPRIAATIEFKPPLPTITNDAMTKVSTWMAGQAKAVAVYDTPFWRNQGLSGDAMSRMGPMVEIHDASPHYGGPYALFGFIGVPPAGRVDEHLLKQHLKAQFVRLFGPEAAEMNELYVKDWAVDPHTATQADKDPIYAHPTYGLPEVMTNQFDGALQFAGTEVASEFGGYIEGALAAAEDVLSALR